TPPGAPRGNRGNDRLGVDLRGALVVQGAGRTAGVGGDGVLDAGAQLLQQAQAGAQAAARRGGGVELLLHLRVLHERLLGADLRRVVRVGDEETVREGQLQDGALHLQQLAREGAGVVRQVVVAADLLDLLRNRGQAVGRHVRVQV